MTSAVRGALALVVLVGVVRASDEKKAEPAPGTDKYAQLFSFPDKITLDDGQKKKLAALRKAHEADIKRWDVNIGDLASDPKYRKTVNAWQARRDEIARLIVRKKNLILTDEQRTTLGIKSRSFTQEKALSDKNVWDLSDLEKLFTIKSKGFDPEKDVIWLTVVTKEQWGPYAVEADDIKWWWRGEEDKNAVRVVFSDKDKRAHFTLTGLSTVIDQDDPSGRTEKGGVSRVPTEVTEEEARRGLSGFRIEINLDHERARDKDAATVKFVYPKPGVKP
jgi:hypothetical protein